MKENAEVGSVLVNRFNAEIRGIVANLNNEKVD